VRARAANAPNFAPDDRRDAPANDFFLDYSSAGHYG